jgi:hypothetical protein
MQFETITPSKPPLLSYVEQQEAMIAKTKLAAATTQELCDAFNIEASHARQLFIDARIRAGGRGVSALYDRAKVVEIVCHMNGRAVGYPVEPLLNRTQAIRMLADLGTPRKIGTFRKLEQQEILIPIRLHTALRYRPKDVIEASKSLKRWSRV